MQPGLRELLERRRNRAIAVMLGVKERECDQHLPAQVSALLRKVILDQVNEYHAIVMDILDSLLEAANGDVALNDFYLAKIDSMHHQVERLVASLEA